MKVKVLQGLNLKNQTTTVVTEMEAVKPELPQFFKDLHPVFMDDFKITVPKTLEVQTHLPNLWKNDKFLSPIEAFSTGNLDFESAKKEMLEIAVLMVSSMSTIPILHAAHKMGLETTQLYINQGIHSKKGLNRAYVVGIGKRGHIIVSAASSGDSSRAFITQRIKSLTNQLIEGLDLPIASWTTVDTRDDIQSAVKKVGFPLVMKPVGLTAGHGVYVGLKTLEETEEAWDKIHEYYKQMKSPKSPMQTKILIQSVIPGDDYRVLVVNGKVEIATHRIPARVVGDGKHTIKELIEIENLNPARNVSLPTHTLKYIVIDDDVKDIVKENGYELDDTPPKDEIVYVRKVASMSQGGITKDVTDEMHPQIKLICESIATTIHANVLGVDVLCKDVTKPLTLDNGGIIEMNTMPEVYLNAFPVIGKQYPDIGEKVLAGIIDPDIHINTVVAVGKIAPSKLKETIKEHIKTPGKTGSYSNGTISINDHEINSNLKTNSAVLSLKKNASLDTIVLHYEDIEEVKNDGFGFNEIDLLIITKENYATTETLIKKYQADNKIKEIKII